MANSREDTVPVWHFPEANEHPPLAEAIVTFNQTALRVAVDILNEFSEADGRIHEYSMMYGIAMQRLIKELRAPMKYIVDGIKEATKHLEAYLAAKRGSAAARKPGATQATIAAATDAVKAEVAAMQATQRAFMWATACDKCGKNSRSQRACKACHHRALLQPQVPAGGMAGAQGCLQGSAQGSGGSLHVKMISALEFLA
jgi:hypothetical protein